MIDHIVVNFTVDHVVVISMASHNRCNWYSGPIVAIFLDYLVVISIVNHIVVISIGNHIFVIFIVHHSAG